MTDTNPDQITGLLTPDELHAMEVTVELVNTLARVVADGPTRDQDIRELVDKIHQIQQTIMSQAAARAYPDRFRLLGETLTAEYCCPHNDDAHDGSGCLDCECTKGPGSKGYRPTPTRHHPG